MRFYSREMMRIAVLFMVFIAFITVRGVIIAKHQISAEKTAVKLMEENKEREKKIREDIVFVESYAEKAGKIREDIFKEGLKSGKEILTRTGSEVLSLPGWTFSVENDISVNSAEEFEKQLSLFGVRVKESEMYWRNNDIKKTAELITSIHPKVKKSASKQFFASEKSSDGKDESGFLLSIMWVVPDSGGADSLPGNSETEAGRS